MVLSSFSVLCLLFASFFVCRFPFLVLTISVARPYIVVVISRVYIFLCSCKLLYRVSSHDLFSIETYFRLLADDSSLVDYVSADVKSMRTLVTPFGRNGGELRCPLPYGNEEYIRMHITKFNARRLASTPSGEDFTMHVVFEKHWTHFKGWLNRWKH